MYNLDTFRERIATFYRRALPYDGRRPTQKDLADAIGLNRSELSSRLNGLKNARLSNRDVKAIVQTLAEWGAITTQAEAQELLALVECPNFSPAEWQAPPLADLIAMPATPAAPPPLTSTQHSTPSTQHHVLPRLLTSFIGRGREQAEVVQQVTSRRLVTLTGSGGVGKTRLALEVASRLVGRFRDGIYFIELASLHDATIVPAVIAKALGIEEQGGEALTTSLRRHLQPREVLLVLDNCEQLAPALADLVEALLTSCPRLHVLATSRALLHIRGELPYRVLPLTLPPRDAPITPSSLSQYEAVQLFVERAVAVQPSFQLATENVAAIHAICQQLDGIPLAIELVVARLNILSLTQITIQLADRFRLLASKARGVPARHQTLQALMDWSYDLLPDVEQALFRCLAVFNGGFTLDAVAGILGVPALDVLDVLTELLNKSLIYPLAESKTEPRFAMLQTIREYALLKLAGSGESATLQRQHSDFFLALAEHAHMELGGPEQQRWIAQLELEHDNLRTAMRWTLADDGDLALRFAVALYRFWYNCGYASEGLSFIEEALSQNTAQDPGRRMKAISSAAGLAAELGNLDQAYALFQQSLHLGQQLDDHKSIATAFANLGTLAMERGEYDQARSHYEQSLKLRRTLGDINSIARALRHLGLVELHQCHYAEAEALVSECLALQRGLGDLHEICISMNSIGGIAIYSGHYAVAQQMLAEALIIARENGDRRNIAVGLHSLAFAAYLTGDYAKAATLQRESITLRREIGYRVGVAESLEGIAMLAVQRDTTLAVQLWGAAQHLRREIGSPTILPDRAIFDPQIERLLSELGEVAFDQALHEGAAMSMDAAVNFALDRALANPPS